MIDNQHIPVPEFPSYLNQLPTDLIDKQGLSHGYGVPQLQGQHLLQKPVEGQAGESLTAEVAEDIVLHHDVVKD